MSKLQKPEQNTISDNKKVPSIILHTLRSKCMEYLRYDVVQPAKEPHIKSTGVRKNKNARENPSIYGR